jgi:CRP/FNR family transcriptional regulator, anaerobic regulatory protein
MARPPRACSECAVRDIALCRVLDAPQLAYLNRQSYRRWYPAGQLIAGSAASEGWCATLLSGVVKLSKTMPDGRQQIVALLFPGDFLGRPYKAEFPYTAETATDVQLCCYGRAHFEGLLQQQSNLKQLFLERTLDSVDAAREWMLLLGRKNAREKVAALLLTILQRTSLLSRLRKGFGSSAGCATDSRGNGGLSGVALGNRQPPAQATGRPRHHQADRYAPDLGERC